MLLLIKMVVVVQLLGWRWHVELKRRIDRGGDWTIGCVGEVTILVDGGAVCVRMGWSV